ncbi:MAG: hypothetical protein IKL44_00810 [Clostridia bacterium]|nr:hypothetical protein [Clostridia bacterium]
MLSKEFIKVYGRDGADRGIAVDWTASGFELNAEAEGDVTACIFYNSGQKLYFSVYINGEKSRVCATDFPKNERGEHVVTLASGLEKGEYNLKVIRQSEAERGPATIEDISFCGRYLNRPEDRDTLIEFLGDSITCGYANLATCDMEPDLCSQSQYEDGTEGYAYLTAEKLGFDFSMLSRQGTGIVAGWDYLTNPMGAIPKVYGLTSFYRDDSPYVPKRVADIVVINLGTNDVYKFQSWEREESLSEKDFIDTIYRVLCSIYEFNRGPKMVVAVGMMTNEQNHEPLYRWYREAIARFESDKKAKIHFCHLPENYDGGKAHPSVAGHRAAAEVLAAFIKENLL